MKLSNLKKEVLLSNTANHIAANGLLGSDVEAVNKKNKINPYKNTYKSLESF